MNKYRQITMIMIVDLYSTPIDIRYYILIYYIKILDII